MWWGPWLPVLPFWGTFAQFLAAHPILAAEDQHNLALGKRIKESTEMRRLTGSMSRSDLEQETAPLLDGDEHPEDAAQGGRGFPRYRSSANSQHDRARVYIY